MNKQVKKMAAVAISTIAAVTIVGGIRYLAGLDDLASHVTMVALLASVIAIDVNERLDSSAGAQSVDKRITDSSD